MDKILLVMTLRLVCICLCIHCVRYLWRIGRILTADKPARSLAP